MLRAPYFMIAALIFLLVTAVNALWLFTTIAILKGFFWLLLSIVALGMLAMGYLYGRASLARARDAFGNGWAAVLALIPVASFFLMFKRSREPDSDNQMIRERPVEGGLSNLVTGGMGVVAGLLLLAAGSGLSYSLQQTARTMSYELTPAEELEYLIRRDGLNATLDRLVGQVELPSIVDEYTTLITVEADEATIRSTYRLATDAGAEIGADFKTTVEEDVCRVPSFIQLLEAGATFEEVYVADDGSPLLRHVVIAETCRN